MFQIIVLSGSYHYKQFTLIGDERSSTGIITRSIVQGSGIEPTLFIIFVIACPVGLTNCIIKYADDIAGLLKIRFQHIGGINSVQARF